MPRKPAKPIDFDRMSRGDIARAFHKTARTISRWRSAGCPQRKDGFYVLADVIDWRLGQLLSENQNPEVDSPALESHRRQRADLVELQLAEKRGELFSKADVYAGWEWRAKGVVSILDALIDRLPALTEGRSRETIRRIVRDETHHARLAFLESGRYTPPVETDGKPEYLRPTVPPDHPDYNYVEREV